MVNRFLSEFAMLSIERILIGLACGAKMSQQATLLFK
jgi:predicted MFS family arabinose efflux permease